MAAIVNQIAENEVMDARIVKLNEIMSVKLASVNVKKRPAVKEARELAKYILNNWDDESELLKIKSEDVKNESIQDILSSRLQNFVEAKKACEKAVQEAEAPKVYKDVNGKEIKAGDIVWDMSTEGSEPCEVFEEEGELAVNVDGTTVYFSEIETDKVFEVVEAPKAEVKLTDKEKVALKLFVEFSEGDEGFILEDVEKDAKETAGISPKSLKGLCASLQKKSLLDMYNGSAYFDGEVTSLGMETYKRLAAETTEEAPEKEAKETKKELKATKTSGHKVGDVHKNGKWVWTEYAPGKFDWRTIPSKKQKTGAKPKDATEKKETKKADKKQEAKKAEKVSKGNAKQTKKAEPKKETEKAAEAPKMLTIDEWVALPTKSARSNKKPSEAQKQAFKLIMKGYRVTTDKKFFEKDDDRKSCNWESVVALFKRYGIDYIPEGLVK